MQSQPKLASVCRNLPDDGLPYYPPSPRSSEVNSDILNGLSLVETDRELFANAVSIFSTLTPDTSVEEQKSESKQHLNTSRNQTCFAPANINYSTRKKIFLVDGVSCRPYSPGHLRKRRYFRDQLVVPKTPRSILINACHDIPASGGYLYFKATSDRVTDRATNRQTRRLPRLALQTMAQPPAGTYAHSYPPIEMLQHAKCACRAKVVGSSRMAGLHAIRAYE